MQKKQKNSDGNNRPLRIGIIAPIAERVPPVKYGGTERVIYALTEELVRRGHEVTLFASGDSSTSARLVSLYPKALTAAKLEDAFGPNLMTMHHIGFAYSLQNQFDVIHDHTIKCWSLPTANISQTPVVMTLHGPISVYEKKIFDSLRNPYLVTVSKSQAYPAPNLNYIANVYHGLNMRNYPFSEKHDSYLLFVGRISREKGVHFAIEVAQYLNIPLIIAAKLNSIKNVPEDVVYFKEYIEPLLSDQIIFVGEVDEQERNKLMSKAMCLLHPITFREPFGLVMIEAMATGCPVVAFGLGSVPEIVNDGKTGFVVSDLNGMIDAILNIDSIDRRACRQYALKNFNDIQMTDKYEKVYREIVRLKKLAVSRKPKTIETAYAHEIS
ncbi:glycosyltransferase family 4 protein [Candidatus Daviesbacteria bacterium]|nr:glycosyltransferase family 4 protein [Candidatus Daviesbacteria bacterium]